MDIVRTIHGEFRWLVAIVAVVVIVKFAWGLIQKAEFCWLITDGFWRRAMAASSVQPP